MAITKPRYIHPVRITSVSSHYPSLILIRCFSEWHCKIPVQPGHYVQFDFIINNQLIRRPLTPIIGFSNSFYFLISRKNNGLWPEYVSHLNPGNRIRMLAPVGKRKNEGLNADQLLVFLAFDSGISFPLSVLSQLDHYHPVHVFWIGKYAFHMDLSIFARIGFVELTVHKEISDFEIDSICWEKVGRVFLSGNGSLIKQSKNILNETFIANQTIIKEEIYFNH